MKKMLLALIVMAPALTSHASPRINPVVGKRCSVAVETDRIGCMRTLSPGLFERTVRAYLTEAGYTVVENPAEAEFQVKAQQGTNVCVDFDGDVSDFGLYINTADLPMQTIVQFSGTAANGERIQVEKSRTSWSILRRQRLVHVLSQVVPDCVVE